MTPLLDYLISVGGIAVGSVFAVLWMLARPRSTAARRSVAVIVFAYAGASTRVVPWTLSQPLLRGFHQFEPGDAPAGPTAIVLLGAGSFTIHARHQRLGVLGQDSAARVLEAAYLFRLFDVAWIISSGGPAQGVDVEPSAVTMRDGLVRLGIPPDRIVLESLSTKTLEEAVLVAPILQKLHPDSIVLDTTDIHMRRALATFHAAGIDAVPALSRDPLNSQSRLRSFFPTVDGFRFTRDVAHEYAGL